MPFLRGVIAQGRGIAPHQKGNNAVFAPIFAGLSCLGATSNGWRAGVRVGHDPNGQLGALTVFHGCAPISSKVPKWRLMPFLRGVITQGRGIAPHQKGNNAVFVPIFVGSNVWSLRQTDGVQVDVQGMIQTAS